MRLTKAQRDENHERIIRAAAKLFREKGVDGVGIDEIMAAADLTHGAFYGHFSNKAALLSEAGTYAFGHSGFRETGRKQGKSFLDMAQVYLSTHHRDDPGDGCAVAAMGANVSRQDASVQESFAQQINEALAEAANKLPGDGADARRDAIVKYATLIGAMVLARSVNKTPLSDELLETVRQKLGIAEVQHAGE